MTTTPPGSADEPYETTVEQEVLDEAAAVLEQVDPEAEVSMDLLDNARRILFVHAHPDDETLATGATMARYAAEGAHVTLITCTLGEEGEVLVPELAHLAADRDGGLGEHRIQELATAMEALGVSDHRFLGEAGRYRDSGMMGTPSNNRPDSFWRADVDRAAADLVSVIRELRPQVLVTYDENGGYGHPDHIQAHRVTMRAAELAADPQWQSDLGAPWQVSKIYWSCMPASVMAEASKRLRELSNEDFFEFEAGEVPTFIVPDDQVTAAVDGLLFLDAKVAAMRAHATQISVDGPYFALSNKIGQEAFGVEYYRLVYGERGPATDADGRERDLFDGVA